MAESKHKFVRNGFVEIKNDSVWTSATETKIVWFFYRQTKNWEIAIVLDVHERTEFAVQMLHVCVVKRPEDDICVTSECARPFPFNCHLQNPSSSSSSISPLPFVEQKTASVPFVEEKAAAVQQQQRPEPRKCTQRCTSGHRTILGFGWCCCIWSCNDS